MRRSFLNISVISMLLFGNFSFAMIIEEPTNSSRITNVESFHKTLAKEARSGNLEKIKSLIEKNKNLDVCQMNKCKQTALNYAAQEGHIRIVKLLLETDNGILDEKRALDKAIQYGRINIVDLLLERNINPDSAMLSKASQKGHKEIVKLLLEKRKDFFDEKDLSIALDCASMNGYIDTTKLLLKNIQSKPSSNAIINLLQGDFPVDEMKISDVLVNAAQIGNIDVFEFLLENHQDLFYKSSPQHAFTNAVCYGHIKIVEFLIKNCPDLVDQYYLSRSLNDAVWNGDTEIVKLLMNKGAKPNGNSLKIATEKKHTEIVRLFLENSEDFFDIAERSKALAKAVEAGYKKIVELFLDYGDVDPNVRYIETVNVSNDGPPVLRSKQSFPMLFSALKNENEDIANLLLSKCSIPFDNQDLTYALTLSAEKGYTKSIKLLLDNGANPKGSSLPLEIAANKGYTEIVRLLLDNNAKPSNIVLGLAARGGHIKTVELLLDKRYGRDLFDEYELSYALSNAVQKKDINIVELLVNNGASPDKTAPYENTSVFSEAVQNGSTEIVKFFLKKGAHPDNQDRMGYTALMYAAEAGHIEIVKLLTEAKEAESIADLNLKNNEGFTALELAEKKGHKDISEWLQNLKIVERAKC